MFTVDRNFFCSPKRKGTRVSLAFCCKLWNHTLVFVNSFRVFFRKIAMCECHEQTGRIRKRKGT